MKSFASDNNSGIHSLILQRIQEANVGHALAYGDDPYTDKAKNAFHDHFGKECSVYFVFNGTAANVLGLKAVLASHQSVLCASTAHLNVDECGAPEGWIGCKLQTIDTKNGKLTPELLEAFLSAKGDQHHVQPKVVSISQSTELGTVYAPEEIKKLADFAHRNDLYLHMDGARLANAAAHLKLPLRAITCDSGVDILSFGGTKNGLMLGEAVLLFNPALQDFKYIRKQGMQLASKMRFIAVQFEAYFEQDLWLKNAQHANAMAQKLANQLAVFPKIKLARPVKVNAVFAKIPSAMIRALQKEYFFYVWNAADSEVRWMTSFDTTEEDINQFVAAIKRAEKQ